MKNQKFIGAYWHRMTRDEEEHHDYYMDVDMQATRVNAA